MNSNMTLTSALVLASLAIPVLGSAAETAQEQAISEGARELNGDEIAELIIGNTVTATLGEKRFQFHYSDDNVLSGKLLGGDWADTGYYGITDGDRVCLSMTKDKGRLRCMVLLETNGAVTKYNSAGDATFQLVEFQDGNRL